MSTRRIRRWPLFLTLTVTLAMGLAACDESPISPMSSSYDAVPAMSMHVAAPPPPAGLVTVGSLSLWPWTGFDLEGTVSDPLNLVFLGDVDLVGLRAVLLSLDGDRSAFGFPDQYPFNCTWSDAHGGMQATYTDAAGWVANAIQLQCGSYDPLRFHIRLFDAGDAVVAAVHLDLLIPNTPEHQVLSWDLPQDLVTVDFLRSGLAAPSFAAVNTPGTVQAIPKPVYDGIPDALKVALGLPPGDAPGPSVPLQNDGIATVLTVGSLPAAPEDLVEYTMTIPFYQGVPRPFCSAGPLDWVFIAGDVEITVRTRVNERGMLQTHNTLRGDLSVTPIDFFTHDPIGPTFPAQISQIDNTGVGPDGTHVNAVQLRKALPPGVGFLKAHLVTGPNGAAHYTTSEKCD